jgi:predicted dehydrogenase
MKPSSLSRRSFLRRGAGAAAVFSIVPRHVLGGPKHTPPSEMLQVAAIGCGGQAMADLGQIVRGANIVALTDVDWGRGAKAFQRWPEAPKYKDFRVMLEKEEKKIDAVLVATPDHTHAVAAMTAMAMGKHVYVEKPMAHEISEVRMMMKAAKDYGVATQMGNQGHSFKSAYRIAAWIEQGIIGKISEVHCWTNRPGWPQGVERPADTPAVPATLDWDLWLGTAPDRPYNPAYLPGKWRGWWDFGTGALGDMGCHILDAPFYGLNLGAPSRVGAEHSGINAETGPVSSKICYEFAERDGRPPVTLYWYDGKNRPPVPPELEKDRHLEVGGSGGAYYVGEKGYLIHGTYSNGPRIYLKDTPDFKPPKVDIELDKSHHLNWVRACKGEATARSNFDYAGPLTEMVLLGNIALRAPEAIEWDAAQGRITNIAEANQYLIRSYREGWTL